EEYFDVIKKKVAVSEATAKIGALLGGATLDDSENLGKFGRTFGILFTLRDEFIDVFELDELKNRVENECLPLPVLFALRDSKKAERIKQLLTLRRITEKEMEIIPDLVMGSYKTRELRREMRTMVKQERKRLHPVKHCRSQLMLLLRAMMEDL
ncbi:MAG TPA: polyprenyl synthetase family protein, partial [Candidatus Hodarchaeales archaeon]|nr:polyprenyl synthetase family protein [Candidatus Hodarchaeales archaeon]